MLKKLFLAASALFLLQASLPAQVTAPKVVLVVGSNLVIGLKRAVQLKQAGIDVQVIFEREAVLYFLDVHKQLATPGWAKKMKKIEDEAAAGASTDTPKGHIEKSTAQHPKFKLKDMNLRANKDLPVWLQKAKDANIPYTLCAASAKNMYDIYDELKATGEPLSPDPDLPVDLSQFIRDGYQILVY